MGVHLVHGKFGVWKNSKCPCHSIEAAERMFLFVPKGGGSLQKTLLPESLESDPPLEMNFVLLNGKLAPGGTSSPGEVP